MSKPDKDEAMISFDKQKLQKQIEEGITRVGRAGAAAIAAAAERELTKLAGMFGAVKQILKRK